jgi:hypothetical protein
MEALATPMDSAPPLSALARFTGIFTSPRRVFEDIRARPTWLIPYIVVSLISIGSNWLWRPVILEEQMTRIQESEKIPADQKEATMERMEKQMTSPVGAAIGIVAVPVSILAITALVAAILYFGTTLLLGSETTYKRIFAMTMHIGYISILNVLVRTPLVLAKNSLKVHLSPGALLPGEMEDSTVMHIADRFDVFEIWGLVLYIIGVAVICRMTTKKSASFFIPLWLVWSVCAVLLAKVFGSFGM